MKKIYLLLYPIFLSSVGISLDKENVNNLVKHGGKYFKEKDYIPYDGIVFDISKETGNRILKFRMISGLKSGSYEAWYSNGESKTIGEYLNDDSTGFWIKRYESGQKEFEKNYKNGKKYGLWTKWYENGIKGGEETYEDNNLEGLFNRWYENGQKALEGTYMNGEKDGSWTKWYESGQKEFEKHYKSNKLNGKYLYWYENGQKKIESSFKDGKERGIVTEWYENGLKREERTFKQILTYSEEGLKRDRKTYKKLFTYYDTGKIKREKNYRNGKEWGLEIFYHDNGNIKFKNVMYKKNGDDNSYLIFTGYDKNGKLIEGTETLWDGFEIKSGECYKDNEEVDCYVPN